MLIQVLFAFGIFIFIVAVFNALLRAAGRDNMKNLDDFLETEQQANYVRKKAIDQKYYFTPDMQRYPIKHYDSLDTNHADIMKKQERVMKKSALHMIKFSPKKSNLEIKIEFGFPNLELITNYEENWSGFFRALIDWAEALIRIENFSDAEIILLNAIKDGCDFSKAFILLADIYYNKQDRAKLKELLSYTQKLDSFSQNKIRSYVNTNISNLK